LTSIDAIINRQLLRWELERKKAEEEHPDRPSPLQIVTVSRQTGSRGSYFASRLAQKMDYVRLNREVIDEICTTSGHRKRIIESLDDKFRNSLELTVESILTGRSIDHSDYIRYLFKVVLSMSLLGGVILMGRGGNFILGPDRGFHIRVVCHREKRIENLIKYQKRSRDEAILEIDESDQQRRGFIRKLFNTDIDSPLNYDLVLNTALIDVEELVEVAMKAIKGKMDKLTYLDHDNI